MLARVRDVSPEEIRGAMAKYMLPVFDPEKANLMVTCAPIMKEALVGNFEKAGFAAEVRGLEEFQDDYGLEAVEGEDEEESDEEGSGSDAEGSSEEE